MFFLAFFTVVVEQMDWWVLVQQLNCSTEVKKHESKGSKNIVSISLVDPVSMHTLTPRISCFFAFVLSNLTLMVTKWPRCNETPTWCYGVYRSLCGPGLGEITRILILKLRSPQTVFSLLIFYVVYLINFRANELWTTALLSKSSFPVTNLNFVSVVRSLI